MRVAAADGFFGDLTSVWMKPSPKLCASASGCIDVWTAVAGRQLMVSFCCFPFRLLTKLLRIDIRLFFGDVMAS